MSRLINSAHVALDVAASSRDDAVRAVAELLRGDARIGRWDDFWKSIGPKQIVDLKGCGCGVCLAHGRDASVRDLVLAAGRAPTNAEPGVPRFVFVFAIPAAMAEDYLRVVGALARLCGEEKKFAVLEAATTSEALADALEEFLS
jgi:mannitol/fructose-specific phosphotransferase system IIA component (Ntr-type)